MPSTKHDYQRDSLKLLGIPLEKIIDGEENPHIAADTIIASTAPRGNDILVSLWAINFLRESFLKEVPVSGNNPSHIYISRKDSSYRNVLNEDDLMEVLGKYNFISYQLSQLSFIEKVRLFASANAVVAHTGAGMANLFFCKPNTKVFELFSDSMVVGPFFDVADKINLDYRYTIAKSVSKARYKSLGLEDHIVADIGQVQTVMKKMMNGK